MTDKTLTIGSTVALPKPELDLLIESLQKNGFQTVGPHLQDELTPSGSATARRPTRSSTNLRSSRPRTPAN
ncbi:MAG: hypothetical protein NTV38_04645, partial [Chloroflexi bacterium]|nr:hypothetical protein [Chloroflexota bacterium]